MAKILNLNTEFIDKICDLYSKNKHPLDIAVELGINANVVRYHLKKRKIYNKNKYDITDEEKEKMIEMYNNNIDLKEIAKKFNICEWSVSSRLKRWNIKLKGPERKKIVNKLNISETDIINKYIELNKNSKETANFFHTSDITIMSIIKRNNIPTWKEDFIKFFEDKKDFIINKYKSGIGLWTIAKELNLNPTTLYNQVHKWGVDIKYPLVTSIERKIKDLLDSLNIKNDMQYEFMNKRFDFYLSEFDLFIETNGDYWHGNPKFFNQNSLDTFQKDAQCRDRNKLRITNHLHKSILFIWEFEIENKWNKIVDILSNLYKNIPKQANQFDFLTEKF